MSLVHCIAVVKKVCKSDEIWCNYLVIVTMWSSLDLSRRWNRRPHCTMTSSVWKWTPNDSDESRMSSGKSPSPYPPQALVSCSDFSVSIWTWHRMRWNLLSWNWSRNRSPDRDSDHVPLRPIPKPSGFVRPFLVAPVFNNIYNRLQIKCESSLNWISVHNNWGKFIETTIILENKSHRERKLDIDLINN